MHQFRRLLASGLLAVNRLIGTVKRIDVSNNASAIVFAPHPDDEVLGCGGVIALKMRAGARVHVVVMTDGRTSHRNLMDEETLVKMRRTEAVEAGRQLGLNDDYQFLEYEDHRLAQSHDVAIERVLEILSRYQPDEIYLPHRHDGIIDHIQTNLIVREAVKRSNRPVVLFEYPVWLWNTWPWTQRGVHHAHGKINRIIETTRAILEIVLECRTRVDVSSVYAIKQSALAVYRTQIQRHNDNERWPILADISEGEFLKCFESSTEMFRRTKYRPTVSR